MEKYTTKYKKYTTKYGVKLSKNRCKPHFLAFVLTCSVLVFFKSVNHFSRLILAHGSNFKRASRCDRARDASRACGRDGSR